MQVLAYLFWFAVSAALLGVFIWAYIRFREKALKAESMQANLPDAVKLGDLQARVAAEEKRLSDIQTQMRAQGTQLSDALEAIEAKRKAEELSAEKRAELLTAQLAADTPDLGDPADYSEPTAETLRLFRVLGRAVELYAASIRALAQRNADVMLEAYELGAVSLTDLLDNQRRYLEIERTYTDTLLKAYDARVALRRARGEIR